MGIKAWQDQDVFLPSFFVVSALILALVYLPRIAKMPGWFTPNRRSKVLRVFLIFAAINLVLVFLFEYYYHVLRCSVSNKYFDTNFAVAQFTTSTLVKHNIPFWAESATLLEAIRLGSINAWDHDIDLSMVDPGPEGIKRIMDIFNDPKGHTHATFQPERRLIQIMNRKGAQGPHADIWFWDLATEPNGDRYVVGAISDFNFYRRPYDSIYPLQLRPWAGGVINVPHQAHYLMRREYGGSYMTRLTFKGDCTHNIFSARWWPF